MFLFIHRDEQVVVGALIAHAAGDEVLQQLALNIKDLLRTSDILARWGGEEFVLCLPDTELADAIIAGEKILQACRQMRLKHQQSTISLTISGGVVQRGCNESLHEVLQKADVLLYEAKRAGRNRLLSDIPPAHVAYKSELLNFHI